MKGLKKGMILAAGFGTRLKPLTISTPKPLLPAAGHPMIEYSLGLFSRSGIKDVAINLHHLGDKIEKYLGDGDRYGLKITYSREEKILGTAGGIKKAVSFFGGEPFAAINCDVITDVNLSKVFLLHIRKNADVTLVVRPLKKEETFTPLSVKNGNVTGFGKGEMMYTGVQILEPRVFETVPDGGFLDLIDGVYKPLATARGRIAAYLHEGFWMEAGTIEQLSKITSSIPSGLIPRRA